MSTTQFSDEALVSNAFARVPALAQCAIAGTLGVVLMPTADATLLPPPFLSHDRDDREHEPASARHLEDVGVEAILGAMIEQKRRASQPSFAAIDLPRERERERQQGDSEVPRTPTRSEVFLKAR
jgi:hypothetical protein